MTTRTWNGATDVFTNAADWTPVGVPVAGDVAVINSGTVSLTSAPTGVTIQLNELAGATTATILALNGVTLDSSVVLTVTNSQTSLSLAATTIAVTGTSTLGGTESFYGSAIQFSIGGGATLVNAGTMSFFGASPITSGGGTLTNNGTLALTNPNSGTQVPVFGTAIAGTGQITLGTNSRIEFDNAVGGGQTLAFGNSTSGNEIAQLNAVGNFGGTISGFAQSDLLAVINTPYTNATYTSTSATSGTLNLYSGSTLEGSLKFSGSYSLSSFVFTFNDFGSGQSNLQITTNASSTGAGGSGGSGGGGSGGGGGGGGGTTLGPVGAVYRFFDTRFGTHFFTSSVGERDDVLANRSADLKEETNGFGDVQSTDTSAVAVYRFFDKNFGTHFFTANAGERDTIINTRPDLTYEANSTFYEHSSLQTGDTAVYRLFDTKTGTQFLTGDNNEYAGLTTAGSATYRADLRSEGVAFYAPTGTFT
ncbi:MAG: hypothetical protein ACRYG8_25130 [Janthinobacterium lividum]